MEALVAQFTQQLREALSIGRKTNFIVNGRKINQIYITGLGGSGIGGKIVSEIVASVSELPIITNNDYNIPHFVNKETLFIACSFSGNTEETLYALEQAEQKKAEISCITSGGKLLEIAKQKGYNVVQLPTGDSPRAMLTYAITELLFTLHNYGVISDYFVSEIEATITLLDTHLEEIKTIAKDTAEAIHNKTAIIYSERTYEGVAIRMRQQLNENAKVLCWHHILPEMNHNEIVGWAGASENLAVIFLRNEDDFSRTKSRIELTMEVVLQHTDIVFEIESMGESRIERSFYHILFGDWVSVYLAQLRQVDPIEVNVITNLKNALADNHV